MCSLYLKGGKLECVTLLKLTANSFPSSEQCKLLLVSVACSLSLGSINRSNAILMKVVHLKKHVTRLLFIYLTTGMKFNITTIPHKNGCILFLLSFLSQNLSAQLSKNISVVIKSIMVWDKVVLKWNTEGSFVYSLCSSGDISKWANRIYRFPM